MHELTFFITFKRPSEGRPAGAKDASEYGSMAKICRIPVNVTVRYVVKYPLAQSFVQKFKSKLKETQTLYLCPCKMKPKRCKAVKNEPLGHFLNVLPFSSVMTIETERNLKTFQIENLAVKRH